MLWIFQYLVSQSLFDNFSIKHETNRIKKILDGHVSSNIFQKIVKNIQEKTPGGLATVVGTLLLVLYTLPVIYSTAIMVGNTILGTVGMFASANFYNNSEQLYKQKNINLLGKKINLKFPVYNKQKFLSAAAFCLSAGIMVSPISYILGPSKMVFATTGLLSIMVGHKIYCTITKKLYSGITNGAFIGLISVGILSFLLKTMG